MSSSVLPVILLFGHIFSMSGWLGGGFLTAFVLGPNLAKVSPPVALEFSAKMVPKIMRFVKIMIGLTFLFGLIPFYFTFSATPSLLIATTPGLTLLVGIVSALIAAILVFLVTGPSFKKVAKISSDILAGTIQQPPPEFMSYSKKAWIWTMVGTIFVIITLAAMISVAFGL